MKLIDEIIGKLVSLRRDVDFLLRLEPKVIFTSVPVYASNAAAIAGGLAAGQIYRSGGDPDILRIVH